MPAFRRCYHNFLSSFSKGQWRTRRTNKYCFFRNKTIYDVALLCDSQDPYILTNELFIVYKKNSHLNESKYIKSKIRYTRLTDFDAFLSAILELSNPSCSYRMSIYTDPVDPCLFLWAIFPGVLNQSYQQSN